MHRLSMLTLLISAFLCTGFCACELQGLRPGVIDLRVVILFPSGDGVQKPGISLELKNNGSKTVYIRSMELLLLSSKGEPWPSLENAVRTLDINQSLGPGQETKLFFKLNDTLGPDKLSDKLTARIIRVNGLPYNPISRPDEQ